MTVAEDLAVTIEFTGGEFSEVALRVLVEELAVYEPKAVHGALARCRRELQGRLSLAAILERLDDGRPGPEEAWALIPKNEADSAVITAEMRTAMGPALALLADGDHVAARMAFVELYRKRLTISRAEREPVRWFPTLGRDASSRVAALVDAVEKGRLSITHARTCAGSAVLQLEAQLANRMPKQVEQGNGVAMIQVRDAIEPRHEA